MVIRLKMLFLLFQQVPLSINTRKSFFYSILIQCSIITAAISEESWINKWCRWCVMTRQIELLGITSSKRHLANDLVHEWMCLFASKRQSIWRLLPIAHLRLAEANTMTSEKDPLRHLLLLQFQHQLEADKESAVKDWEVDLKMTRS